MINFDDLQQGLMLQHGRELLKVSNIYPNEQAFTVQVLFKHDGKSPWRTAVRRCKADELDNMMQPTARMMGKYRKEYSNE